MTFPITKTQPAKFMGALATCLKNHQMNIIHRKKTGKNLVKMVRLKLTM